MMLESPRHKKSALASAASSSVSSPAPKSSTAAACDAATPAGATVTVDGVCWEHVHSDLYNVYDASYWASAHDGNKEAALKALFQVSPARPTVSVHP